MDPTGRRTGNACDPVAAKTLLKTLDDAESLCHKNNVANRTRTNREALEEAVDNIRGGVMICYPMGLPEWDNVRQFLEHKDYLSESPYTDDLSLEEASMWFAGKQCLPENQLSEHLGRHENTRAVIKLTKKGQGAPAREPVIDEQTHKAMLAWYHKKQEEQKVLEENEEDDYLNSSWANPNSLKRQFAGLSEIKVPR
eukprot:evm.model.scf_2442.2 EVM.evm.TU.scf_2442.2   scf_2442:4773-9655(+)